MHSTRFRVCRAGMALGSRLGRDGEGSRILEDSCVPRTAARLPMRMRTGSLLSVMWLTRTGAAPGLGYSRGDGIPLPGLDYSTVFGSPAGWITHAAGSHATSSPMEQSLWQERAAMRQQSQEARFRLLLSFELLASLPHSWTQAHSRSEPEPLRQATPGSLASRSCEMIIHLT